MIGNFRRLHWIRHFVVGAALVLILSHTQADELVLSNGDILRGVYEKSAEGKIHFRSEVLGLIVIDEGLAVVKIAETEEADVDPGDQSPEPAQVAQAPVAEPPRQPTAKPDPDPATRPESWIPAFPRDIWPFLFSDSKSQIEFGFSSISGRRDRSDLNIRTSWEKRTGKDHLRFNARYMYGTNNGVRNTDRRDGGFRWRRQWSDAFFGQSNSTYDSNRIRQIDYNFEQNFGVGWKFLTTERQTSSIGPGLTYQMRSTDGTAEKDAILGEIFQDYSFKINERITFSQESNFLYSPSERGARLISPGADPVPEQENYKWRFNSIIRGRLTESVSLNLRYEYEFDNTIIDPAARAEQRITSSIGYSF